jgi:hypothetical protein
MKQKTRLNFMKGFKQIINENMKKRVESLVGAIADSGNFKAMVAWNEYDDTRKGAKFDEKHLKKAKEIMTKYKVKVTK